ncbi:unnamed protein product [Trifolium pratense]|uniref:Uncharacterized protein n=1 Tax=Trifolium pratense TaxID=57577 RepID=A0ACB0JAE1_TRIPR|nr:unnamed protein product [Trifolium pratense]
MASTALSAAESANTTRQSPKKEVKVEGDAIKNGVFFSDEKKPDLNDGLDHLDSPQCIERFTKYENEYTHRLLAKYFSGKSLNGGTSFYEETTIDGEIVKSSRLLYAYENALHRLTHTCLHIRVDKFLNLLHIHVRKHLN